MLIAAASGRALAASARRGGFAPLVADRFGDLDTRDVAERHALAELARPIDADRLLAVLGALADGYDDVGLVCGTGFEDRPDLLRRLSERWRLLGNAPETVAVLKDPIGFAGLCRDAGVPHPQTSLTPPQPADGWLVKRAGGAGGWHIRDAVDGHGGDDVYYQRRVDGRPVSAALLGNGRAIRILGFSEQWTAPTVRHRYRYGGALRPAAIETRAREAMAAAIGRLNDRVPLCGLNSADFLVDGGDIHLLEINPRPGATLDLFEPRDVSLFALHVQACDGRLPDHGPVLDGAMATAILYAERTISSVPPLTWPDWTADRPVAGSRIDVDEPVCTVTARAATAEAARHLVDERCVAIRRCLAEAS